MPLKNGQFYDLVKKIAGTPEASLLEIQGIRSVYSFLNTEDVFEILNISCSALNVVKKQVGLVADDNSFIVKPGCRSGIQYLYQLLHKKHEEHLQNISIKPKRKKQMIQQPNESKATDHIQDLNQSESTVIEQSRPTLDPLKIINQHEFLIQILNEWVNEHSTDLYLPTGKLIQDKDFRFVCSSNETETPTFISCSCGINVQLSVIRGNISLSNFYKHLKTKTCMKKKKSKQMNHQSNEIIDQENLDSANSQNNSICEEDIQCFSSTSSIDTPSTMSQSFKRTTDQDVDHSSKKKRV